MRLVAFGHKVCNIDNLEDSDDEKDKEWMEVFAAKCRKMPQVVAWMEEVLRVGKRLQDAYVPDDDDDFA